ncbi:MAG: hypothetical protein HC898_12315, partial [Phycisphaerales bacterium]|nr:hypothetical protein [Phycisphaerales bacterium]
MKEFGSINGTALIANMGGADSDVVLASINPMSLPNGQYEIEIIAKDSADTQVTAFSEITIDLADELKVGNFRLSFTDLTVSVGGVPLSAVRTYDSLHRDAKGDFGYGWSLDILGGKAEVNNLIKSQFTQGSDILESEFGGETYQAGTTVTLTLPGGQKQHFTAILMSLNDGSMFGGAAGAIVANAGVAYAVAFLPASGQNGTRLDFTSGRSSYYPALFEDYLAESLRGQSYHTMNVTTDANGAMCQISGGSGGEYSLPFNPAHQDLDFRLTQPDGTEYIYDSRTGDLYSITQPDGKVIYFSKDEVALHQNGERISWLTITRDPQHHNRITSIAGPDGIAVEYSYNATGDLIEVEDRTDTVTQLAYGETIGSI